MHSVSYTCTVYPLCSYTKTPTIYSFAILNRLLPKIAELLIPPQPNTDNSSIYHLPTDYSTCHYWVVKLAPVPRRPLRVSQSTRTAGSRGNSFQNASQDFCLITASWMLLEFHILILLFSNQRVCCYQPMKITQRRWGSSEPLGEQRSRTKTEGRMQTSAGQSGKIRRINKKGRLLTVVLC